MTPTSARESPGATRAKARPAVGPRLRLLLGVVFVLFALLCVDSAYLGAITALEAVTGRVHQDWFYLCAFVAHLALGALLTVPALVFSFVHLGNTRLRRNRRAVRAGYGVFGAMLVLLVSGVALVRLEGLPALDGAGRSAAYWAHLASPVIVAWLFVLHRLAGPRIRWRVGFRWAVVAAVAAGLGAWLHGHDPRSWGSVGSAEGVKYFEPSLARTLTGKFIPPEVLQADDLCRECHADTHAAWRESAHAFSSFNNPAYLFSVRETRKVALERDGSVRAARFCAGCHDPVPFFGGRFDDPDFDDVADPTAQAGITCTTCHAITHVNSVRGNSDFTIDEPMHYPFTFSDSPALRWVSRQLVKAKPAFHKRTFLKPLHRDPAFCGSCHKVHLPQALNHYKWLRGQNHYDSFWQSGVSGHAVAAFYMPKKAQANCNGCHMALVPSEDFAAAVRDDTGVRSIHDHLFPSANTALPVLTGRPDAARTIAAHEAFTRGTVRVDIFGVRADAALDGALTAPLRPELPALRAGASSLIEIVLRTLKVGHHLTQGTADSNELWLEVTARDARGRVIGRSGALDGRGELDPAAHRVNAYVLDREGHRIDRRNAQDIFVPLYDNQIPPGNADVVHYRLDVPADAVGPIEIEAALRYRKFDAAYMRLVRGAETVNDLPVMEIARDSVRLPVAGPIPMPAPAPEATPAATPPAWERWNDYGIGLFRKGRGRQLRQAEEAFREVERLGRTEGPINVARVYLQEGRVEVDAPEALARATRMTEKIGAPWTHLWLSAVVDKENGRLSEAVDRMARIVAGGFPEAVGRGFDFAADYRLLAELGQTTWLWAQTAPAGSPERAARLNASRDWFERVLTLEPEDLAAHWGLKLVYAALGDPGKAAEHEAKHAIYKPDDNARDVAVARARTNPWANHAAEPVVIYLLSAGDPTPESVTDLPGGAP